MRHYNMMNTFIVPCWFGSQRYDSFSFCRWIGIVQYIIYKLSFAPHARSFRPCVRRSFSPHARRFAPRIGRPFAPHTAGFFPSTFLYFLGRFIAFLLLVQDVVRTSFSPHTSGFRPTCRPFLQIVVGRRRFLLLAKRFGLANDII